jgi:hypothetical protein
MPGFLRRFFSYYCSSTKCSTVVQVPCAHASRAFSPEVLLGVLSMTSASIIA